MDGVAVSQKKELDQQELQFLSPTRFQKNGISRTFCNETGFHTYQCQSWQGNLRQRYILLEVVVT